MKITDKTREALGLEMNKRYYSIGPTTLGYLGLLLVWAVIVGHIHWAWLAFTIPLILSSFGVECQEVKKNTLKL